MPVAPIMKTLSNSGADLTTGSRKLEIDVSSAIEKLTAAGDSVGEAIASKLTSAADGVELKVEDKEMKVEDKEFKIDASEASAAISE